MFQILYLDHLFFFLIGKIMNILKLVSISYLFDPKWHPPI